MSEFLESLPVHERAEVSQRYQLQYCSNSSNWLASAKSASVLLVLLSFSGLPALFLLEAYHCLQIGAALNLVYVGDHQLFLLFYLFILGGNLPTLGLGLAVGSVVKSNSVLILSDEGILLSTDMSKTYHVNAFGSVNLPTKKLITWQSIDSVSFGDGVREGFGMPQSRLVFTLTDGSRLEQILNGLSLGEQARLLGELRKYVKLDYSPVDVSPTLKALPAFLKSVTVAGAFRNFDDFEALGTRKTAGDLLSQGSHLKNGVYTVEKILPAGGFANVYLASRISENGLDKVVLKEFILPARSHNSGPESRGSTMLDEIAVSKCLNNPSIVSYLDDFIEDQRAYLVTRYFESTNLLDLVKERGPLPLEEVIEISIQLCNALKYLHSLRPPVIHRDLTPHNILVSDIGEVKVIDFNAALHKFRKPGSKDEVIGKPKYLPPEQFRGLAVRQSDIYALGCDMFYMLTGVEPLAITQSHPLLFVSVPAFLEQIVARATALDFKERYGDADALFADLLAFKLELESNS